MGLFSKKSSKKTIMHLRGFPADPGTNKCLLMAAEKGIQLQTELLDISAGACDGPEYRQLSPFGKAPCLKEGDFITSGAQAILAYMDIRGKGGSLNPKKASILGEQNYWIDVAQRLIDPNINVLVQPLLGTNINAADENNAKTAISHALNSLESAFADERRFLVGEYSFADIHWTASMHLCVMAGHKDLIDAREGMSNWYKQVSTRKSNINQRPTYEHLASLDEIREKRLKSVA